MAWQDTVGIVTSGITAGGVVVGGWWAYQRFVREAPHWTRADPSVRAELIVLGGRDVLRVRVAVKALGQTRITFRRDNGLGPVVTVYAFTRAMLDVMEPAEWTDVLIAQSVLTGQEFVEAGETVGSTHLLPIGRRIDDALAYRVEFSFEAEDPALKRAFWWGASEYVVLEQDRQEG